MDLPKKALCRNVAPDPSPVVNGSIGSFRRRRRSGLDTRAILLRDTDDA